MGGPDRSCSNLHSGTRMTSTAIPDKAASPRVVLFMSTPSAGEIPLTASLPASLLPFGCVTFAEQVLDSCARAGLKEVDLVMSEQPEALRAHLADGWRWGITLNWHLAKESATPYGFLHSMSLSEGQRVLIGHGDRWVADSVVRELVEADRVALHVGQSVEWSGWASVAGSFLRTFPSHADFESLGNHMVGQPSERFLMVPKGQFACAGTADDLMRAQEIALSNESGLHVPATWLRFPWGAMSPDARVHAQADIRGPVLIGPRCSVDRRARIGPGSVLSRDVLVASGAVIREALVLPDTYLSGGVTLEHSVIQGNVVQDLRWAARLTLPQNDGVLGTLKSSSVPHAGWAGRVLGVVVALACLPVFIAVYLFQWLRRQPKGWIDIHAVRGRHLASGALQQLLLRGARTGSGWAEQLQGCYGSLLDVVQGRRRWFGVRPREKAQWYALRRDWQILFSNQPVGLFHAPAWSDRAGYPDSEALAAADAFFTVRISLRERLRVLRGLLQPRQGDTDESISQSAQSIPEPSLCSACRKGSQQLAAGAEIKDPEKRLAFTEAFLVSGCPVTPQDASRTVNSCSGAGPPAPDPNCRPGSVRGAGTPGPRSRRPSVT